MDLQGILLSELKSDRERQILYILAYIWNLGKIELISIESRLVVEDSVFKIFMCYKSPGELVKRQLLIQVICSGIEILYFSKLPHIVAFPGPSTHL